MRGLTSVLWSFVAFSVTNAMQLHKIHERMTPSERMQVFDTSDENVPDYEIVPIHLPKIHKRSTDGGTAMHLKAFGKNIELWLKPTDRALAGLDTPIYSLETGKRGPILTKYSRVIEDVLQGFEDLEKSAVFTIKRGEGDTRSMIGTIQSENLIIAPIPERLVEEVKRQRRSIDNISASKQDDHLYHIVYQEALTPGNSMYSDVSKPSPVQLGAKINLTACSEAHRKCVDTCGDLSIISGRKVDDDCGKCLKYARTFACSCPLRPDTIYPRILIVVAHDYYKKFNNNHLHTIAYLLAFWNAVDLKYRYFENPKFRLNIAGIVLSEDAEVLKYMTKHAVDESTIDSHNAVNASGRYWYARKAEIPLDNYDVVVTMTSKNLCSYNDDIPIGLCNGGILGVAHRGGACKRADDDKTIFGVVMIHDKTAFDGIHATAHELAHAFGAQHDGPQCTTECSPDYGYIMSPAPRLTDKSAQWSNCTVKDIQQFLDENPTCLNYKPNERQVLPVLLPGRFMNVNEQCRRLSGTKACQVDDSICQALHCNSIDGTTCQKEHIAAADGTPCGSGKICLNGVCLGEPIVCS